MLFTSAASRERTINHLQMLRNLITLCDARILISTLKNMCVESWLVKQHTKAHSLAEPASLRDVGSTAQQLLLLQPIAFQGLTYGSLR